MVWGNNSSISCESLLVFYCQCKLFSNTNTITSTSHSTSTGTSTGTGTSNTGTNTSNSIRTHTGTNFGGAGSTKSSGWLAATGPPSKCFKNKQKIQELSKTMVFLEKSLKQLTKNKDLSSKTSVFANSLFFICFLKHLDVGPGWLVGWLVGWLIG
jgi:hypothetical protein